MSKPTAVLITAAFLSVLASTAAVACTSSPPVSAEVAARREQTRQSELWARSDAVFLAELSVIEQLALPSGQLGMRADLTPSLALKGEQPRVQIDLRHSTLTGCGFIPFFDALRGTQGDWFVVFARDLPGGLTVDATIPVDSLVNENAVRAWRKVYAPTDRGAASGA